jgi:hypothetical protein
LKEPVELTELRALVAQLSRATRRQPYELMMELGFELIDLQGFGYHCTPVNALAFGATGGDGVHLSVLDGEPLEGGVVVTVPVGDIPNSLVAASFHDFLRLGYYGGFAWLEELGYMSGRNLPQSYTRAPDEMGKPGLRLLTEIRERFRLSPFDDVVAHLEGLRHYADRLVLPDQEEWAKKHGV